MPTPRDPYEVLGVSRAATDADLRSAYHRLVQLHHPDHNGGSAESARKFEEVQEAYARIREQREHAPTTPKRSSESAAPKVDPHVESRIADLERELKKAQAARDRAMRAAREAAAATDKRPTDEELGYVRTDDTLADIVRDARVEFSDRLNEAREHPQGKRLAELIDELAAKLTGEQPKE